MLANKQKEYYKPKAHDGRKAEHHPGTAAGV